MYQQLSLLMMNNEKQKKKNKTKPDLIFDIYIFFIKIHSFVCGMRYMDKLDSRHANADCMCVCSCAVNKTKQNTKYSASSHIHMEVNNILSQTNDIEPCVSSDIFNANREYQSHIYRYVLQGLVHIRGHREA